MFDKIEDKIARIDALDKGKPRKKVTILGAGMAGLVAAYELSRLGHSVEVFEASDRVGGRVWTKRFPDGQYHEFGAMRIPQTHDHTRYYANLGGLQFRRFINNHDDSNTFYFLRGIKSTHKEFIAKLIPKFDLTKAEIEIVKIHPLELFGIPLNNVIKEIRSNNDHLRALFAEGPITKKIEELEKVSLGEFLRGFLSSQDALDFIGATTGLEVWWDMAVTMYIRDEISQQLPDGSDGRLDEIIGGTDLLPTNLSKLIKAPIFKKHEVLSINKLESKIQLQIKDNSETGGNNKLVDCDYVICTIPFPVLRRMKLLGMSVGKQRAIRDLNYASSTKVLINCKQRFWETEYRIIGGGSQTDLISRAIYYPSDNFHPENKVLARSKSKGIFASYSETTQDIISDDISMGPGVLVGSYCWGSDAKRLGGLSPEKRAEVVIQNIANFHPEILEAGMVKGVDSMFWDEYPWAGAAFCFMKPGDFITYYTDTIASEGNLFFAGEHCSLDQGWIQGAIIGAFKALEELVSK